MAEYLKNQHLVNIEETQNVGLLNIDGNLEPESSEDGQIDLSNSEKGIHTKEITTPSVNNLASHVKTEPVDDDCDPNSELGTGKNVQIDLNNSENRLHANEISLSSGNNLPINVKTEPVDNDSVPQSQDVNNYSERIIVKEEECDNPVDSADNQNPVKREEKRKSNLLPLDIFFAPSDEVSSNPINLFEKSSKKRKVDGTTQINNANAIKEENIEEGTPKEKTLSLEDGEIPEGESEEAAVVEEELRELEEGELPEDVEKPDKSRNSVITKSVPIDFDDFNRKRKVALLLAYCGAAFYGMQKNPDVETIELKLMEALAAIRAIRPDLKTQFLINNNNQLSFNRAARTDKGVSAARQVVSLKLVANENFLEDVNKHLPKEIRVFGIERVTKTFDAKCSCSGRSYEYLVPSLAFAPSKDIMDSSYRLTDEQLNRVNEVLAKYVGTHNFHNFTSGKRFTDRSAIRYITEFKCGKGFECRGHEFVALEVKGQSFLIHQIRKMLGLCMAICRGYCGIDTLEKSWLEAKLDIPKAPGLGLLLNRVHFSSYNDRYGNDGRHNALNWEYCELEVERYKIEYLWHTIIEEEIKKSSLVMWLKTLNNHTYTEAGMNPPMSNNYKGKKGIFPTLKDKRRYDARKDGHMSDFKRKKVEM